MKTTLLLAALLLGVTAAHGAERSPLEAITADVQYLASPALEGRASETMGSRLAREYIEAQFKAAGLAPWGKEKAYSLPFAYGTNVIGVLPGGDPRLAAEFVLLSAHYDHEGKSKGKIYPGAADNASGVGALLAVMRELSASGQRPRRSIVFAAFDAEEKMMLGSVAFAIRDDVAAARIAAVVNIDMLGRSFMDVVEKPLFVAGTEGYPEMRAALRRTTEDSGLNFFPVGLDLVGPRSDQVAFQDRSIPVLFLSCGVFADYHQPTDTADRLDFVAIEGASRVVRTAIGGFADAPSTPTRASADSWRTEELEGLVRVTDAVLRRSVQAGMRPRQWAGFNAFQKKAGDRLALGGYSATERADLLATFVPSLPSSLVPMSNDSTDAKEQAFQEALMQDLAFFYLTYPDEARNAEVDLIKDVLHHRPGLFRTIPKFTREFFHVPEGRLRIEPVADDPAKQRLVYTTMTLGVSADLHSSLWSRGSSFGFDVWLGGYDLTDETEHLIDTCLLHIRQHKPEQMDEFRKVLRGLTGTEPPAGYDAIMAARFAAGGFKDETEWLAALMRADLVDAIEEAGKKKDPTLRQALGEIVRDQGRKPWPRTAAIKAAAKSGDRSLLLAVAEVLADPSPAKDPNVTITGGRQADPDPGFASGLMAFLTKPATAEKKADEAPATIGDFAWEQLKAATGKKFAKDSVVWRKWLESHSVGN